MKIRKVLHSYLVLSLDAGMDCDDEYDAEYDGGDGGAHVVHDGPHANLTQGRERLLIYFDSLQS